LSIIRLAPGCLLPLGPLYRGSGSRNGTHFAKRVKQSEREPEVRIPLSRVSEYRVDFQSRQV
jgi:hypothetical protein